MKVEKCQICEEWMNKNKIAMHYWNVHKEKYSEYKATALIKEIEDVKTAPAVETAFAVSNIEQEELTQKSIMANANRYSKVVDNEKPKPKRDVVNNTKDVSETVYFEKERTGYNSRCWIENDIEGETINEWC